jgi:hypothetical protein
MFPRLGAACGALFSVALFAANGEGNPGYAATVVGLFALLLFLPFLSYLYSLLREAEGENGWLSTTAFAAGLAGTTIKLLSGAPEIADRHVTDGTPLHKALGGIADAATVISLYPLAVLLAAVAALTFRTEVLPRWLGLGAAATAIALAVNGSFLYPGSVPGLLLFVLWTLIASVVLFRRARHQPARATRASLAAS